MSIRAICAASQRGASARGQRYKFAVRVMCVRERVHGLCVLCVHVRVICVRAVICVREYMTFAFCVRSFPVRACHARARVIKAAHRVVNAS